jgi:hypothetical protein
MPEDGRWDLIWRLKAYINSTNMACFWCVIINILREGDKF